jgi:ectoine hydroxylase-related dioxygenase (phytanoyl-CoA dioxygenase family)
MENALGFQESFKNQHLQSSILEEYRDSFAIGSDPNTLNGDARAIYEGAVAAFNHHAKQTDDRPSCGELFARTFQELSAKLDVRGSAREDAGGAHLTRHQQDFFAKYGVLPAIHLESLASDLVSSVDRLCCGLVTHEAGGVNGLSATPAWIFDRDLLALATHPSIVEKVASLLGDELTFLGSDGPMFLPPNSTSKTAWHAFDAEHFGGGGKDGNLQLVSVWVALADANVANGCMKIAPGSYRAFNTLDQIAPRLYGVSVQEAIDELLNGKTKVEPVIAAQIVCRRLNDKNFPALMRLGSNDKSGESYRYNPFHSAVDRAFCIGERELAVLDDCPKVALEAKRGEAFFFTSQNAHASFRNTTPGWRKAIALRYVKTATARKGTITQSSERLRGYLDIFPGASELLRSVGRPVDNFEDAAPRLCVRGRVPEGQEQFYFDTQTLTAALARMGGTCLTRVEPLPIAA